MEHTSSRQRTFLTSASGLNMIYCCMFTSTTSRELASTICVNCKSSDVLSRQTRLTPSCVLLRIIGLTTVIELLLDASVTNGSASIGSPCHVLSSAYPQLKMYTRLIRTLGTPLGPPSHRRLGLLPSLPLATAANSTKAIGCH